MENHFFCGRTSFTSFRCKQNIFNETPNQRQFKVKSLLWKIKYCLFEDKNIQYKILNIQFTISSHSIVAEMFRLMPFYCEDLKSPTTDTMSIIWSIVHVLLERLEAHTNTSGDVTHPRVIKSPIPIWLHPRLQDFFFVVGLEGRMKKQFQERWFSPQPVRSSLEASL